MVTTGPKRPVCAMCLRPQQACICRWITPASHAAEVLILQHPLEAGNAKNSARLLHLCLPHSRLVIGETFAEPELRALLHAPLNDGKDEPQSGRQAVLLYPDTPEGSAVGIVAPPEPDLSLWRAPGKLRLVVLDGTWRKSRKMLYLNPLLQRLPRVSLTDAPASRYLIRKAHGAHQLSTFEAVCHALARIEDDCLKFQPLLDAFDGFIAQQSAYHMPRD